MRGQKRKGGGEIIDKKRATVVSPIKDHQGKFVSRMSMSKNKYIRERKKKKRITHLEEEYLWLVDQAWTRIGQERHPEHLGWIKHVVCFQVTRCSGGQNGYGQTVVVRMILGSNFNERIN